MRHTLMFVALLGLTATAGQAHAQSQAVRFLGIHPISAEHGGGFCYIEFPHVHVYAPNKPEVLYRHNDDGYVFVGDPVPYGYEGPKQAYYGPHPIYVDYDNDVEYCYLQGPHYHPYAPPTEARFKLKAGVYFFAGDLPREYNEGRPRYARINAVYKPLVYERPVVVVTPPPEYHGDVYVETAPPPTVVVERPVVRAGVHVEAGIGIGFGGGIHIGSPPPPPPTIVEVRPSRTYVIHEERPVVHVIRVKERGWKDRGWKHGHGRGRGHGRWED